MGESIKEVPHVVLRCVKLPVVGPGVVVLAVNPVRVQLPPVRAEHFGRCGKESEARSFDILIHPPSALFLVISVPPVTRNCPYLLGKAMPRVKGVLEML